jgi:hypothetical protein
MRAGRVCFAVPRQSPTLNLPCIYAGCPKVAKQSQDIQFIGFSDKVGLTVKRENNGKSRLDLAGCAFLEAL